MATSAFGRGQTIYLGDGTFRIATPFTMTNPSDKLLGKIAGNHINGASFYIDVGSSNDGLTFGDNTKAMIGLRLENVNLIGPANCCKSALVCNGWTNFGGTENVNLVCGSASNVVKIVGCENCTWDFAYNQGIMSNALAIANYGVPTAGILATTGVFGGGTYNKIRVRKSGYYSTSSALALDGVWDWEVEQGNIENCYFATTDYWAGGYSASDTNNVKLYNGGTTRIAQTFTLGGTTAINNICAALSISGTPQGNVLAKIYSTSSGPNAVLYTSTFKLPAQRINPGGSNPFPFVFRFPGMSLAAGTYAVSFEYTGGDASNYVRVNVDPAGTHSGTCYTYSGAAWHAQTYDMRFAVNAQPSLKIYNHAHGIKVKHIHFESNWWDLLVDQCYDIDLENLSGASRFEISRSTNVNIGGANDVGHFVVDPVSRVTINGYTTSSISEVYGDVVQTGNYYEGLTYSAKDTLGMNYLNQGLNYSMARWKTDAPDSWTKDTNVTWTQEGSIVHAAAYSAKLEATTAPQYAYQTFPAATTLRGNWVTWSGWLYVPTGQTFTGNGLAQLTVTVAGWADATDYKVGDGVAEYAICVVAGTSGGVIPNFAGASTGDYLVDGTVLWVSTNLSPSVTIDLTSWSDSTWHRFSLPGYIPTNATNNYGNLLIPIEAGGTTTVYIAEPTINYGSIPSRGFQPAVNETPTFIQVGANRMYWSSLIPSDGSSPLLGQWAQQGDVCWSTVPATGGHPSYWQCTVSGVNGSSSTWVAHNL